MTHMIKLGLATAAMVALSGCVEDTGSGSTMMQPAPGSPPFIEGNFGASDAAVAACRNALQAQVTGGVTVVGSEFSQANSAVYMRVGADGAPWRCLVGDDGSNPSLEFQGSEGFL